MKYQIKQAIISIIIIQLAYFQEQSTPEMVNPSSCVQKNEIFNVMHLECDMCSIENSVVEVNQYSCGCEEGTEQPNHYQIGFQKTSCVECVDGCGCENYGKNSQHVHYDQQGKPYPDSATKDQTCVKCNGKSVAKESTTYCDVCPHHAQISQESNTDSQFVCRCQNVNGVDYTDAAGSCIRTELAENSNNPFQINMDVKMEYYDIPGKRFESATSKFINDNWLYYTIACSSYKYPQGCQILANMCALNLYNKNYGLCKIALNEQKNKNEFIPQIENDVSDPTKISGLNFDVTFDPNQETEDLTTIHNMQYYIREYDFYGNMLNFRELGDEFLLCPHTTKDVKLSKEFGVDYENKCEINMESYITQYETKLYELFIKSDDKTFFNVPVLIKNLRDEDQKKINDDDSSKNDIYVNRFFIVDNESSKNDDTGVAKVLRFAANMRIVIKMLSDRKIYVPILQIEYEERIVDNNKLIEPTTDISYKTEYINEGNGFKTFATVLIVLFALGTTLVGYVRIVIWKKYNPSDVVVKGEGNFALQAIGNSFGILCQTYSQGFFYYLMIMTGYWFVFYKMQSVPYSLIPPVDQNFDEDYKPFNILFFLMAALNLIGIIYMVYKQTSIDIFFIDWEPEVKYKDEDDQQRGISIWRTLFVANELNELSTERSLSIEWNLMILGFFMVGLEWEDLACETPNMDVGLINVERNYILKFFLAAAIYLIIGLSQLTFKKVFEIWFPMKIKEFTDLCTVANISLFILDHDLHGYYLHGMQKGNKRSEGNAHWIQDALLKEAQNKGIQRGLNTDVSDDALKKCQMYEMLITKKMREHYEDQYITDAQEMQNSEKKKQEEEKKKKEQIEDKVVNNREEKEKLLEKQRKEKEEKKKLEQVKKQNEKRIQLLQNYQQEENKKQLNIYLKTKILKSQSKKGAAFGVREMAHKWLGFADKDPSKLEVEFGAQNPNTSVNQDLENTVRKGEELEGDQFKEEDTAENNYWPYFYYDTNYEIQSIFFLGREFQLLLFNIYVYSFFDIISGSTLLGIVMTYFLDKIILYLREDWGQTNLHKKTLIDKNFLI